MTKQEALANRNKAQSLEEYNYWQGIHDSLTEQEDTNKLNEFALYVATL